MIEYPELLRGGLTPSEQVYRDNLLEIVLRKLSARDRFVVKNWLLSNKKPRWIARKLKVSQSRVYQIRDVAIRRMTIICRNLPQIFN